MNDMTLKVALQRDAAKRELDHAVRVLMGKDAVRIGGPLRSSTAVALRLRGYTVTPSGAITYVNRV
jgi:hypothetical protein